MNIKFLKFITPAIALFSLMIPGNIYSQETTDGIQETKTLFPYPSAPEDLPTMLDKSNYLIDHFWDSMDFKSNNPVDQNLLNDAFKVYTVPIRWAEKTRVNTSVDKLLEKISKNPVLQLQFTKAAEECLYGPRAEVWVDEVYIKFLSSLIKNKKVPDSRKKKYANQLSALEKSLLGGKAPEFKFTARDGREATYFSMTTPTMLIFCDPTLPDWRMSRLRMETNLPLKQAVDKGQINILFIVPSAMDNWKTETENYPEKWTVGYAPEIGKTFDFRVVPSIYVVDSEGKIVVKNVTPASAIDTILGLIKKPASN